MSTNIHATQNWVKSMLNKKQVGLGNVDNTSDADKPISTATQNALDAIADTLDVVVTNVGANTEAINKNVGCSASSQNIHLTDSENTKLRGLTICGKTLGQPSGKGYQLFDTSMLMIGSEYFIDNKDGSFTITSMELFEMDIQIPKLTPHKPIYFKFYDINDIGVTINSADVDNIFEFDPLDANNIYLTFEIVAPVICDVTLKIMAYQEGDGTWEPYTGGKAFVSPDFPQDLINVGNSGSITTKVLGNNFFNPLFISTSKISPSVNINTGGTELDTTEYNGKITVAQNNYTDDVSYAGHYSNGMFYIKLDTLSIKLGERYTFIADVKITNKLGGNGNLSAKDANGGNLVTFNKKDNKIYGVIIINSDTLDFRCNGMSLELSNIMLIHGDVTSSLPDYEPYKEQTFTLNTPNGLPGVPVSSGGNYTDENGQQWVCDEIDIVRGKYIKRIDTYTTKDTTKATRGKVEETTGKYQCFYLYNVIPSNNNTLLDNSNALCNKLMNLSVYNKTFEGFYVSDAQKDGNTNDITINVKVERLLPYGYIAEDTTTHVTSFSAWLIDNPLTFAYILAEPVETDLELTEEGISQYKALTTHKPVTNIFNDADAHMKVDYVAVGALPSNTTLADIPDDSEHRTVTDEEKEKWNTIVSTTGAIEVEYELDDDNINVGEVIKLIEYYDADGNAVELSDPQVRNKLHTGIYKIKVKSNFEYVEYDDDLNVIGRTPSNSFAEIILIQTVNGFDTAINEITYIADGMTEVHQVVLSELNNSLKNRVTRIKRDGSLLVTPTWEDAFGEIEDKRNKVSDINDPELEGYEEYAYPNVKAVKDYVDAKQGEPGITPHIGDNGNWYIGETDTGVRAEALAEGATVVQSLGDSETDVMSQKAVTEALVEKEDITNKSTTIDDTANDTKYPSTKAVKDYVDVFASRINLFNKEDERCLKDYYIGGSTGVFVEAEGYIITHPIKVGANKTYKMPFRKSMLGNNKKCRVENDNGDLVKVVEGTLSESEDFILFSFDDNYIVRFNASDKADAFIVAEENKYPDSYVPYGVKISGYNIYENPLVDKKITFNGDSICYGAGYRGGYGKIIAENNNMIFQNIGVGGGTITAELYNSNGTARHWICRTIENMDADADYAIVEGGVNDSSLAVPLGSISSGYQATLDDTTFYGAFESMLKQLTIRFAGKKIGYIAVHQMSNKFRVINEESTSYYWAARKCCEKWGVPFLDLNATVPPFGIITSSNTEMYPLVEAYTNNADGWHPNEEGYKKYYVPKIEAWLKTL